MALSIAKLRNHPAQQKEDTKIKIAKELILDAVDYRVDGKSHDYTIRLLTDRGDWALCFASSLAAYNPGEMVMTTDGKKAIIAANL